MSMGGPCLANSLLILCQLLSPMQTMLRACLNMSTNNLACWRRRDHWSCPSRRHLDSADSIPCVMTLSINSAVEDDG